MSAPSQGLSAAGPSAPAPSAPSDRSRHVVRTVTVVLRLAVVAAVLWAVGVQLIDAITNGSFVFWNFFGYFTMQSNLILAAVFTVAAVVSIRHRVSAERSLRVLSTARGAATVYIITTGIVYNALLAHAVVGPPTPVDRASDVLHRIVPVYAVLDWLLFSDRARLAMRSVWAMLGYPLGWLAVVLVRGATDGWVPYPFLNPGTGYASVSVYCVVIAASIAVLGVLVVLASRLRVVRVD